jgi:hypothetical protein
MLKTAALIALSLAVGAAQPAFALGPLKKYEQNCANVLELLPRIVRKSAVEALGEEAQVSLHSICGGVHMTTFGNAGGLVHTIGLNATLVAALAARGWRPDDVVGISIVGDHVDLYVHRN